MKASILVFLLFTVLNLLAMAAEKSDPQLTIKSDGKKRVLSRSELLARPDRVTIEIDDDATYAGKTMKYEAVPIFSLFQGVDLPADATVVFHTLDGFSASLPKDELLNRDPKRSVAYLAIEKPDQPWPALHPSKSDETAGPFYLIWKNTPTSRVSRESWPYQIAGFEVKPSLKSLYPAIFPTAKLTASRGASVQKGLAAYIRNCLPCHTVNHQGPGRVGPDLNLPLNPTEYFVEGALKKLIRNPESVRKWDGLRMNGFPESDLSNSDLESIIQYLKEMSREKTSHTSQFSAS